MSEQIKALQALVTKVVSDVNAKLASISTEDLSSEDQKTVFEISSALTELDNRVGSPAPASPPAA
jgi:hypothetical protein